MPSIYITINHFNKDLGILPYQYIGSDQNDNTMYLGSSKNLKSDINRIGYDHFTKETIEWFKEIDNKKLRCIEAEYLKKFNVKHDETYYNLTDIYAPAGGKKGMKHKKKKIVSQKWIDSRTGRLQSPETKEKMSKAKKGKKLEDIHGVENSRKIRQKHREGMSGSKNHNALVWNITYPDGTIVVTKSLRSYCRENGLSFGKLYNSNGGFITVKYGNGKGGRVKNV